ncbi:MAG TPA: folate-binding protein [Methylophilus sp.]
MTATQWQSELMTQGAHIEDGAVQHFGDPLLERKITALGNVLCDLSHLGLLELKGADTVSFLQGQVTNDVKLLRGDNAHYSGYCSPKGRLLALFLAFAHQDHVHLQLPQDLLAPIMKRLTMYVMRSKVVITDTSDSIIKIGVNGPDATRLMQAIFGQVPSQDYALVGLEQATLLKLPTAQQQARYEIFTSSEHAQTIWNSLKTDCQPVGKACWDSLEIQAGIPEIVANTQEQFVPQMVNLDCLNAINFKKGCYTGQEIVARTHYLGTVKRRTFLASIVTDTLPMAGDKLLDANNSEVGQLVRVAKGLDNNIDVLAELRIEAQQTGTVYWQGQLLRFNALPYSLGTTGT